MCLFPCFLGADSQPNAQVGGSADGGYALYVDITYKDGSNTWGYTVPFDTGTHGWQYKAGVIDEGKAIKSLTVHAMFRWHTGMVRLAVILLLHFAPWRPAQAVALRIGGKARWWAGYVHPAACCAQAVFDDLGVSLLKDGLCDYMQFVSNSIAAGEEEDG